jgi:hypothetical protein
LAQAIPQPPQFATSLEVSTQAPLQAKSPAAHSKPHLPATHVALAFSGAAQAFEQAPQWAGSV